MLFRSGKTMGMAARGEEGRGKELGLGLGRCCGVDKGGGACEGGTSVVRCSAWWRGKRQRTTRPLRVPVGGGRRWAMGHGADGLAGVVGGPLWPASPRLSFSFLCFFFVELGENERKIRDFGV